MNTQQSAPVLTLKNFEPSEFHGWFVHMNPNLLRRLDAFREQLGAQVIISPAPGAVGRHLGLRGTSQHNIDRWGEVRAVDVMPQTDDMHQALAIAQAVGFHGIGLYPDWKPHWGMHLDMRTDRTAENPALWSGLMIAGHQQYFALERAFERGGLA